jgi:hypothetical protein
MPAAPSKLSAWRGSNLKFFLASVMCITVDRLPGSYIRLSTFPSGPCKNDLSGSYEYSRPSLERHFHAPTLEISWHPSRADKKIGRHCSAPQPGSGNRKEAHGPRSNRHHSQRRHRGLAYPGQARNLAAMGLCFWHPCSTFLVLRRLDGRAVGHFRHVYALYVRVGERVMDPLAQRQIGSSCSGSDPIKAGYPFAGARTVSISCETSSQSAINGRD